MGTRDRDRNHGPEKSRIPLLTGMGYDVRNVCMIPGVPVEKA